MNILCMTSHKYTWMIKPFCYLLDKYWPKQDVVVATDIVPDIKLPKNFMVKSYSGGELVPSGLWSNALIYSLERISSGLVVLMLEDYWLIDYIDNDGIKELAGFMGIHHSTCLRMDLTTDRMYNGYAFPIANHGRYELVETPSESEYQMSFQAGIWNRRLLLEQLRPGLNPWETEVHTQPPSSLRVVGTKQHPMKYINIAKSGGASASYNYEGIPEEDMVFMKERGWIEDE